MVITRPELRHRILFLRQKKNTVFIDLVKGILSVNGEVKSQCSNAITQTYIDQHRAIINNDFDSFCSYNDGLKIIQLIETIEKSTTMQAWINV